MCSFGTRRSSVVVKQHNVYVRNYNFIFKLQSYLDVHDFLFTFFRPPLVAMKVQILIVLTPLHPVVMK